MSSEQRGPLHCVELNTGRNLSGILNVGPDEMSAKLYSYGDGFSITSDDVVCLKTEELDIASLHNIVLMGPRSLSRSTGHVCQTHKVIANTTVIGPDAWNALDTVKVAYFTLEGSMNILKNQTLFGKFLKSRFGSRSNREILKIDAAGKTYKVSYAASYNYNIRGKTKAWPIFSIEYKASSFLKQYFSDLMCISRFISFCLGEEVNPGNIRISKISERQMLRKLRNGQYHGEHKVHYIWPKRELDHSYGAAAAGSPFAVWDDSDLSAMRDGLLAWIARESEWNTAYALMSESLALRGEMSGPRMINACNWFSNLPNARIQKAIKLDHIELVAQAGGEIARQLGYSSDVIQRIKGKIKEYVLKHHETSMLALSKRS
ncbi:hypothetical protein [Chenggangzhangella methanolivorans]|uniref:Uncharacterized protein n=1 Tax=Chenggangzhangella methanolivorans TaxID=1437009 RepID=A0A9E6RE12_9HYPH|nr:hypothetical protein [Chenggangzhangella methanolivorans]QZO01663.1 hypothetical protein K6K41_09835 [Chenggangzhangella methanolivorans]